MPDLLDAGAGERFKGVVHVALFGLALTCALYSWGARCCRSERHLVLNGCVYGALALFELRQVSRHLKP